MIIYTVKPGDNLFAIARQYGVNAGQVAADNGLNDPARLVVGQALVINRPERTYTVQAGQTAGEVARLNGISRGLLWRYNPGLGGREELSEGQILTVALPRPTGGEITVLGYAYPYIEEGTLRATLPYLTYLSIFTYGIRPDGGLVEPDDARLIALAREYGVGPLMHLSSLTENGTFSSDLAAELLRNGDLRERLVDEIYRTVSEKGYVGVDIDFEYVPADAGPLYVSFITQVREALAPQGYEVLVALAPKYRADQPGLLYEGHNYGAIGDAADRVLLMTYEWGYSRSAPMAVSPVPQVRRVLEYGVTEIEPRKILMGVPNYGYNWPLPYVAGETVAKSLGNAAAIELAAEKNAAIGYDETSQSPFFTYFDTSEGNVGHEVWFEDARSYKAQLGLIPELGVNGVGVWNIMRFFAPLWVVLSGMFEIRRLDGE